MDEHMIFVKRGVLWKNTFLYLLGFMTWWLWKKCFVKNTWGSSRIWNIFYYLLGYMTGCLWKSVLWQTQEDLFLDMKHILVLTQIYDRLFVKKVFCEKHRRIFFWIWNIFYYLLGFKCFDMKCSVFVKKVFCENTWGFLKCSVFVKKNTGRSLVFFV